MMSIETPTTVTPLYSWLTRTNVGSSALHPPHVVAHRFRTTGLPRKSDSFTTVPEALARPNDGATERSVGARRAARTGSPATSAAATNHQTHTTESAVAVVRM